MQDLGIIINGLQQRERAGKQRPCDGIIHNKLARELLCHYGRFTVSNIVYCCAKSARLSSCAIVCKSPTTQNTVHVSCQTHVE